MLVLEDLSEGAHWPPPWRPGDVELALATLEELAATRVTELEPFAPAWNGWLRIAEDPQAFVSLGVGSPAWLERCLPALLEAEKAAPVEGEALLHCDVRSDNLCVRDRAARARLPARSVARRAPVGVRSARARAPGRAVVGSGRALAGYDGTVLLVTHDRVFLDRFGAGRTIEL